MLTMMENDSGGVEWVYISTIFIIYLYMYDNL